jgi:hypothetical protein
MNSISLNNIFYQLYFNINIKPIFIDIIHLCFLILIIIQYLILCLILMFQNLLHIIIHIISNLKLLLGLLNKIIAIYMSLITR